MFNKYFLTFQSINLELEYRESQIPVIQKEFTVFSVQACFYMLLFSVQYFKQNPQFIAVQLSCCFVIIFIIFSKFLVDKYPSCINFILPVLQIMIAIIQGVDQIFELNIEKLSNSDNFKWFYGFCACYFHFGIILYEIAIFIQGYLLWSQAIVVIVLLLGYVGFVFEKSFVFGSILLNFISIIIGMIAIKYCIENRKRQEFLYNRERKKWFAIIETVLEQSIMVIKLDKQQDQLRIHQMNNITKEILQINNDNDLRTILRNFKLTKDQMKSLKDKSFDLEIYIRQLLEVNLSPANFTIKQKDQTEKLFNTFLCQSQLLHNFFKIQLINYWTDEQKMIIMTSESLNDSTHNQEKQELQLKNKIITALARHCLNVFYKEKNNRVFKIQCVNFFASLDILINPQIIYRSQKKIYSNLQILRVLRNIFGNQIIVKMEKLKIELLKIDLNSLLIVIFSLIMFKEQNKGVIKFSSNFNEMGMEEISIKIKLKCNALSQHVRQYLSKPLYFQYKNSTAELAQQLQENVQWLDKKLNHSNILKATTLTITKFLLWLHGSNNQIKTKQKNNLTYFQFTLLNQ